MVEPDFDINGYSTIPDGKTLMPQADMHMTRIPRSEMDAGDVVVIAYDSDPQHFGILTRYPHGGFAMVHAASRYSKVIETRLLFGTSPLSAKFVASFRLPGVA
jgi:cell wall-associated NlpC family hydrolase